MRTTWKVLAAAAALLSIDTASGSARTLHRHAAEVPAPASGPAVTVFKSPSCGCCKSWVEHLKKNGYAVTARDVADVNPLKDAHGVPQSLRSCHTALVGGYVIEGHVPADVVARLLRERPKIAGLAVPGMPAGSPGMEMGRAEHYDVIAFDKAGKTRVYASR